MLALTLCFFCDINLALINSNKHFGKSLINSKKIIK